MTAVGSTEEGVNDREADLARIAAALEQGASVLRRYAAADVAWTLKDGRDMVTAADHEVDALLRNLLPQPGDGWLSEETPDDAARLGCRRVWVVDPIDGTRGFVARRPQYAVSIALVEDGEPVLGGICNPGAGVTVLGGPGLGVRVEGDPRQPWPEAPAGALRVLASRSEHRRGEWSGWERAGRVAIVPVGSVAYKLAVLAAGHADATWTLQPKHEWDVAAGVALVRAAGGECWLPDGSALRFNQRRPRYAGFAAARAGCAAAVRALLP